MTERKGSLLTGVLAFAAMIVTVMQTQAVPILGLIATKLHVSTTSVSWVTTATLLSAAVCTPLLGRIGDLYGKKPTLLAVLVVAAIGSTVSALADSLGVLLVGRALQGVATAIFPLALAMLREEIPHARLHNAMAIVSGTLGFGGGLGLVATGLLTKGSDPNYHIVFWFTAVLSVLALIAAAVAVPATGKRHPGSVDLPGAVALGGFLVLLLLPISQGHEWGWTSAATLGCFAASIVFAVAWVIVERKVAAPLVDLKMFAHRPVLFTNLSGMFIGFAMFLLFMGISYLAQMPKHVAGYGFEASILRASVEYLLPTALASMVAAPIGGILVGKLGGRLVLALAGLVGTAGFAWLALSHDGSASVIWGGVVVGAAISLAYAAMPALIAGAVPHHQSGIANGINSISRTVGSSLGSAIITTLLTAKLLPHLPLPEEGQFTVAFWVGAGACAATILAALLGLRPEDRDSEAEAEEAELIPAAV
ncbi:MFS transporter [Nocardia sp. CDC159]|uniref:MFS transporter n=1 Tax=Nocardia pulmonis TaxID=2951408 RepID=A0A9X2J118_9NOCA|nr:MULTISPECIES: MFS transporter [Nocardia]MCM6777640.1 MFS transporter [Nocardia pulmonis]MCM6790556.1 MFS transporter [Nocardia sp. CDC159]